MQATSTDLAPALFVSLLAVSSVAGGASLAPTRDCFAPHASTKAKVADCTSLIQSREMPDDARALALYNRGVAQRESGRIPAAIVDYTAALRMRPAFRSALLARGAALLRLEGKVPLAIQDFDRAIELDPDDAFAYYNRAVGMRIAKNNDRAMFDFSEAIRLDPLLTGAWNGRGALRQTLDDHEGAIADFDVALRLEPQSWSAYNNRGVSRQALGDAPGALEDFNRAVSLNSSYTIALANRGAIWRALGHSERARQDLDNALRLDPKLGMAHFNRGVLELDRRRFDLAVKDFTAAADLLRDLSIELWLFIARQAIGPDAPARLEAALMKRTPGDWPDPIAEHLLGRIDTTTLLQQAAGGARANARLCEARFFAAERILGTSKTAAARPFLEKVIEECPPGFVERDHAATELLAVISDPDLH